MIDIADYERMPGVMAELKRRLSIILTTETSGRQMLHRINTQLVDIRARLQREGVEFPVMTAIVVPSLALLELVRADLDRAAIRQTFLNFVVKYPGIDLLELAEACKAAFPSYRPD